MHAVCSLFILAVNLVALLVILFTSLHIHWTLKRQERVFENYKVKQIHKQVTRILIIQTLLPTSIICVPIGLLWFCSTTGTPITPILSLYASLSAAWLAVIKPAAAIFFIESYRRFVFEALGCSAKTFVPRSWATGVRDPSTVLRQRTQT